MWHSSFVLDESLWTVNIYNLERPNQYFLRIPFDPNLQSCPRQPPIGPLGIGLDINAPRVQYLYCDYREEFTKLEGGLKRSNANHPFPLFCQSCTSGKNVSSLYIDRPLRVV